MNSKGNMWLKVLLALIILVPLGVMVMNTNGQEKDDRRDTVSRDQWEYLVVSGASNTNFSATGNSRMRKDGAGTFGREAFVLEQHLDKLGANGWELVAVTGSSSDPIYYFKRRK